MTKQVFKGADPQKLHRRSNQYYRNELIAMVQAARRAEKTST